VDVKRWELMFVNFSSGLVTDEKVSRWSRGGTEFGNCGPSCSQALAIIPKPPEHY
jgi:hypothetical protein